MPDSKKFPILPIITGPTGSGKTALAVDLADEFEIEIISADSRQVYRLLDIGTAKPSVEERGKARFHLINLIEPGESYSAFRFIHDAERAVDEILGRRKLPVIVGGTGLYLRALTKGLVEMDEIDIELRQRLQAELEALGPEAMHDELAMIDPDEAARVHANNRARVLRALEIFYSTGTPKSKLLENAAYKANMYRYAYYCLALSRDLLYDRINERVNEMFSAGLLEELQSLIEKGFRNRITSSHVIGYAELLDYLDGKIDLVVARERIKQNSRRFAKRQLTWFRNQEDCLYFDSPDRLREKLREKIQIAHKSIQNY